MAQLVKFGVIRNMLLCRQAQQNAATEHRRAVIQRPAGRDRHTHRTQNIEVFRLFDEVKQARLRAFHQLSVLKQVAAGVARHRKLRERDDRSAVCGRLADHLRHLVFVVRAVRHLHVRCSRQLRAPFRLFLCSQISSSQVITGGDTIIFTCHKFPLPKKEQGETVSILIRRFRPPSQAPV